MVLGYLALFTASLLVVLGLFLYQAYQYKRVKSVLFSTIVMSLGMAALVMSSILREVEGASSLSVLNLMTFVSLALVIAGVYLRTSRYMVPGFVFDAETRKPIPLAIVRVFAMPYRKLVDSRVTDKYGRYGILAEPGTYVIDVSAVNYRFPSRKTAGYKKERFTVEKPMILGLEIPMDPVAMNASAVPAPPAS